jgi:amino-acid N-acetyltransferase
MDIQRTELKEQKQLLALQSFLEDHKLPFKDIRLDGNLFLVYNNAAGNIIGSGGIERYGNIGLLRSVAVRSSERGKKLGQQIVEDILQRAKELRIHSVFLLTETAHDLFLKMGFNDLSRDDVPEEIKSSSEFSFVCPASAKCMVFNF